jgi:hypothetical protein
VDYLKTIIARGEHPVDFKLPHQLAAVVSILPEANEEHQFAAIHNLLPQIYKSPNHVFSIQD